MDKKKYQIVSQNIFHINHINNGIIEYHEAFFKNPFHSCLSLLIFSIPAKLNLEIKKYKNANKAEMLLLKK
jgi:hypothetical protein